MEVRRSVVRNHDYQPGAAIVGIRRVLVALPASRSARPADARAAAEQHHEASRKAERVGRRVARLQRELAGERMSEWRRR